VEVKILLNDEGFNLWADDYDKSVGLSDEVGTYPFAGYKIILNTIYNRVLNASSKTVLDIGFGTGTLTSKLYERGCAIYGQDFSDRMIELAQEKMPNARLFQGDFSKGLVDPLTQQKYDTIIATYSLHHLTDLQKVSFLKSRLMLLNEGGCIYIGDVAFETCAALQKCKDETGDEWDDDEIYFVYDELKLYFPTMQFEQMSNCAGLISLRKTW
jgi:putative AdoMet-dependent methyltransferase